MVQGFRARVQKQNADMLVHVNRTDRLERSGRLDSTENGLQWTIEGLDRINGLPLAGWS